MKCDRFIGTGNTSSLDTIVSNSKFGYASKSPFAVHSHSTVEVSSAKHAHVSNYISHGVNPSIRSTNSFQGLERRQIRQYSAKISNLDEDHSMFFCDKEESKKATYVTFENRSKFRIPVFAVVDQHQSTLPVIGELRSNQCVSTNLVKNVKDGKRHVKKHRRASLSISSRHSKV